MAEVYSVTNGGVALVAATAKTVLELSTGATVTARLVETRISIDATTSGTLLAELISATTGTGTGYTPKKRNGQAQNRAANCTAKINDTVEPSSVTVLQELFKGPLPVGPLVVQEPLDREWYLPVSSMFAIRLTCSIVANGFVSVAFEE